MALWKEDMHDKEAQKDQKKRSRITIDVSPELRRRIKMAALKNDLSISEYIGDILEQAVPDEESMVLQKRHPVPLDILEELDRVREQVIQDSKGYIFPDSAEALREQREERTKYLEQLREQP